MTTQEILELAYGSGWMPRWWHLCIGRNCELQPILVRQVGFACRGKAVCITYRDNLGLSSGFVS